MFYIGFLHRQDGREWMLYPEGEAVRVQISVSPYKLLRAEKTVGVVCSALFMDSSRETSKMETCSRDDSPLVFAQCSRTMSKMDKQGRFGAVTLEKISSQEVRKVQTFNCSHRKIIPVLCVLE